jgi:hypothetical protein
MPVHQMKEDSIFLAVQKNYMHDNGSNIIKIWKVGILKNTVGVELTI